RRRAGAAVAGLAVGSAGRACPVHAPALMDVCLRAHSAGIGAPAVMDDERFPGIPPMRLRLLVLLCTTLTATSLSAQEWATTCHARSSYDVTLKPSSIRFDRPSPAPFHVEMQQGTLRTDGTAVPLNAEQQD